eukprot:scaffold27600_cov124-Isochrysis_galbana.AAC.4
MVCGLPLHRPLPALGPAARPASRVALEVRAPGVRFRSLLSRLLAVVLFSPCSCLCVCALRPGSSSSCGCGTATALMMRCNCRYAV